MIDDQSEGLVVYIQDYLYFCVVMYFFFSPCWNTMFFLPWNMGSQFEDAVPFDNGRTLEVEKNNLPLFFGSTLLGWKHHLQVNLN